MPAPGPSPTPHGSWGLTCHQAPCRGAHPRLGVHSCSGGDKNLSVLWGTAGRGGRGVGRGRGEQGAAPNASSWREPRGPTQEAQGEGSGRQCVLGSFTTVSPDPKVSRSEGSSWEGTVELGISLATLRRLLQGRGGPTGGLPGGSGCTDRAWGPGPLGRDQGSPPLGCSLRLWRGRGRTLLAMGGTHRPKLPVTG